MHIIFMSITFSIMVYLTTWEYGIDLDQCISWIHGKGACLITLFEKKIIM